MLLFAHPLLLPLMGVPHHGCGAPFAPSDTSARHFSTCFFSTCFFGICSSPPSSVLAWRGCSLVPASKARLSWCVIPQRFSRCAFFRRPPHTCASALRASLLRATSLCFLGPFLQPFSRTRAALYFRASAVSFRVEAPPRPRTVGHGQATSLSFRVGAPSRPRTATIPGPASRAVSRATELPAAQRRHSSGESAATRPNQCGFKAMASPSQPLRPSAYSHGRYRFLLPFHHAGRHAKPTTLSITVQVTTVFGCIGSATLGTPSNEEECHAHPPHRVPHPGGFPGSHPRFSLGHDPERCPAMTRNPGLLRQARGRGNPRRLRRLPSHPLPLQGRPQGRGRQPPKPWRETLGPEALARNPGPRSPGAKSCAPKRRRTPRTDPRLIGEIRRVRWLSPNLGKAKLPVLHEPEAERAWETLQPHARGVLRSRSPSWTTTRSYCVPTLPSSTARSPSG